MLLKNLDLTPGSADRMLVNGSRGVVCSAAWYCCILVAQAYTSNVRRISLASCIDEVCMAPLHCLAALPHGDLCRRASMFDLWDIDPRA